MLPNPAVITQLAHEPLEPRAHLGVAVVARELARQPPLGVARRQLRRQLRPVVGRDEPAQQLAVALPRRLADGAVARRVPTTFQALS